MEQTASTNSDLLNNLKSGHDIDEGFWLRAERQTQGRGRLGRDWISSAGNLFCSTLVHIGDYRDELHAVSFLAALSVGDTLSAILSGSVPVRLKWPNDVLACDAKVAGILLERQNEVIVVGIGVNIAHSPVVEGRATTALNALAGGEHSTAATVMPLLADKFADWLGVWRSKGGRCVQDAWMERGHVLGERLTVSSSNGEKISGMFAGLEPDGALRLSDDTGQIKRIYAGDVTHG